jgi:hypothetical protein
MRSGWIGDRMISTGLNLVLSKEVGRGPKD